MNAPDQLKFLNFSQNTLGYLVAGILSVPKMLVSRCLELEYPAYWYYNTSDLGWNDLIILKFRKAKKSMIEDQTNIS